MNKTVLLFTIFILLSSCLNIREEYPKIDYYVLNQESSLLNNLPEKNLTVMVRNVVVNESIDTRHILINSENSKVQKLYYHRWLSDLSTIATDFLVTRLINSGMIKNGVVRSGSFASPDYIIEAQIIEMKAFNSENTQKAEDFYAEIKLKVDILKFNSNSKPEVVFSNTYDQKYVRKKPEIKFIPEAYSKVLSVAVDNLITDLTKVLN